MSKKKNSFEDKIRKDRNKIVESIRKGAFFVAQSLNRQGELNETKAID